MSYELRSCPEVRVKRPIIGYGTDEEDDWFAILDCGHRQHVRHRPPFVNRPWATTVAGRQRFLGHELDCVRCDRLELPDAKTLVLAYRTPIYSGDDVPATLAGWNESEKGHWLQVVPGRGQLRCQIPALDVDMKLTSTMPGIVPPQTPYRLVPNNTSSFRLETYRVRRPRPRWND